MAARTATPAPADKKLHLKVMVMNQTLPETVDIAQVPVGISVLALKERIELVAPSHPPVAAQRLIFHGHVLPDDSATIWDALGHDTVRNSDLLTLHLVFRRHPSDMSTQPPERNEFVLPVISPPNAPSPQPRSQAAPVQNIVPPQPQPQQNGAPQAGASSLPPGPEPPRGQPVLGLPAADMQQYIRMMHQVAQQHHAALHTGRHQELNAGQAPQPPNANFPVPHVHHQPHPPHVLQQQQLPQQVLHAQWRAGPGIQHHFLPFGQPLIPPNAPQVPVTTQVAANANRAPTAPHNQHTQHLDQSSHGLEQSQSQSAQGTSSDGQHPHPHHHHHHRHHQHLPRPPMQQRYFSHPIQRTIVPPSTSQQLAHQFAQIHAQSRLLAGPTCFYVLWSPQGPEAMLYHNESAFSTQFLHGTPTTSSNARAAEAQMQTARQRAQGSDAVRQDGNQVNGGANPANGAVGGVEQAIPPLVGVPGAPIAQGGLAAAVADANRVAPNIPNAEGEVDAGNLLAPLQPLLGHFWMLFRILVFAYFFVGGDGLRRSMILAGIVAAFFILRGVDAGGGLREAVREWWEGVVGVPRDRGQGQRQDQEQGQGRAHEGNNPAAAAVDAPGDRPAAAADGVRPPADPVLPGEPAIPPAVAQAARAIVDPAGAQVEQLDRDAHLNPIRRRMRPVERALALFVASLWPGVGENTIRARREEENRVRRDREAAAAAAAEQARREEEEAAAAAASAGEGNEPALDELHAQGEDLPVDGPGETSKPIAPNSNTASVATGSDGQAERAEAGRDQTLRARQVHELPDG